MRHHLTILAVAATVLVSSCSHKLQPGTDTEKSDSVFVKEITFTKHDTTFLPGGSVEISVAIPCPEAKLNQVVKSGKTTLTATIDKGFLKFKCNSDSLMHIIDSVIQLKEKTRYITTTKTIRIPVEVPKPYIPKWVWCLLAANVAAVAWKFRNPIKTLITKL